MVIQKLGIVSRLACKTWTSTGDIVKNTLKTKGGNLIKASLGSGSNSVNHLSGKLPAAERLPNLSGREIVDLYRGKPQDFRNALEQLPVESVQIVCESLENAKLSKGQRPLFVNYVGQRKDLLDHAKEIHKSHFLSQAEIDSNFGEPGLDFPVGLDSSSILHNLIESSLDEFVEASGNNGFPGSSESPEQGELYESTQVLIQSASEPVGDLGGLESGEAQPSHTEAEGSSDLALIGSTEPAETPSVLGQMMLGFTHLGVEEVAVQAPSGPVEVLPGGQSRFLQKLKGLADGGSDWLGRDEESFDPLENGGTFSSNLPDSQATNDLLLEPSEDLFPAFDPSLPPNPFNAAPPDFLELFRRAILEERDRAIANGKDSIRTVAFLNRLAEQAETAVGDPWLSEPHMRPVESDKFDPESKEYVVETTGTGEEAGTADETPLVTGTGE